MFGPCKVCQEKDKRVEDLKAQIKDLQDRLSKIMNPIYPQAIEIEADTMLNGANTFAKAVTKDEERKLSAVEEEAIKLLTGTY